MRLEVCLCFCVFLIKCANTFACRSFVTYESDGCRKLSKIHVPDYFSGVYSFQVDVSLPDFEIKPGNFRLSPESPDKNEQNITSVVYSLESADCVSGMEIVAIRINQNIICKENPDIEFGTLGHSHTRIINLKHELKNKPRNRRSTFSNNPFFSTQYSQQLKNSGAKLNKFQSNPFLVGNNRDLSAKIKEIGAKFTQEAKTNEEQVPPIEMRSPQYNSQYTFRNTYMPFLRNPFLENVDTLSSASGASCGMLNDLALNLIHGGDYAAKGDFPWTAAIFLRRKQGTNDYICAGNQVSDKHIITAAHCTNHQKHRMFIVRDLIHLTDVPTSVVYDIRKIHQHPGYERASPKNDIAVLTVSNKMPGMPVCLWPTTLGTAQFVGVKGVVLGWGYYSYKDERPSDWLKMINMPIVSDVACLHSNERLKTLIAPETFCAGDRDSTGPCSGDSGGGFNLKVEDRYYLRGIVSTALPDKKKCDLGNYVIFTDVAKHLEWIKRIVDL